MESHKKLSEIHNRLHGTEVAQVEKRLHRNGDASQISPQHSEVVLQEDIREISTPVESNPSSTKEECVRITEKKLDIGVSFQNLNVYGFGTATGYHKTFANYPLAYISNLRTLFERSRKSRIDILRNFEGLVASGEMLLVLGRPGAGCTTLLKTLAGYTHGLHVDPTTVINYQGMSADLLHTQLRGECTYQPESDVHFPHLTVAQTLDFATQIRPSPDHLCSSGQQSRNAVVSALNLRQNLDTKVGDPFVQGVSGGERKRTSIAEVLVGNSRLQCWDNSTRGLDSANALRFVQYVRQYTAMTGTVAIVTLYQASEEIYSLFDKVAFLYNGRQVYFGRTDLAMSYFTKFGFVCPSRSTTADFLCSLSSPTERIIEPGQENESPRTADDFAQIWCRSPERAKLLQDIQSYNEAFPAFSKGIETLKAGQMTQSWFGGCGYLPFRLPYHKQVRICIHRCIQRLLNDLPPLISAIVGNAIISIILGSMFYNMPETTSSFFGRGVLLFFTILTNTFLASFEGVQLWQSRPIVEKHVQYAFNRPSAEAIASMVVDIPNKVLLTAFFNLPFYFLANMRRTPAAFFTFYLFAFVSLLTGSMLYRTIGALSRTLTASIAPGADFILLLVIYTGYVLPIPSMHPWFSWFRYIDPVGYAFESLMINEFAGRDFACSTFIPEGPNYLNVDPKQRTCAITGANPMATVVQGTDYLEVTFQYYPSHLWRNLGIIFAIMSFLCCVYLLSTEYVIASRSKGEILLFCRGQEPKNHDEEAQNICGDGTADPKATREDRSNPTWLNDVDTHSATFIWDNLSYDVKLQKGGSRRLLNDVEGWIQPGTLTALMGASGAGKTTLLNVLANRASTGIVSGEKIVDMKFQDEGFARKVGYAQQHDINLPTATVREALIFSARLRQLAKYSDQEKLVYVDEVLETLDLTKYANAVIGVSGEGLNIEQRKRVTIGVELAARPELLLFLDEPTSGLDSNTAWSICTLLRKLAKNVPILCTIHQPSGALFEMFDRLLFLKEGQSIYFGEIGPHCRTLIDYFQSRGARDCELAENPAEWLLEVTSGSTRESNEVLDWPSAWKSSQDRQRVKETLATLKEKLLSPAVLDKDVSSSGEFASPIIYQLYIVVKRNLEHDWRTPSYLYSKLFLTIGAGLVNGFSFYKSESSLQGVQNQIFSVFLIFTLHSSLVQLIMPQFLENRDLYELNERPSRTYSWCIFILSNVLAELPWQILLAVLQFVTWYYPIGMYRTALLTDEPNQRAGLIFLTLLSYMTFSSTFSQMIVSIMPDATTGINISALFYSLSLIFCGVLVSPSALPRFWIFMYNATPITYFVNVLVSTGVSGVDITCSPTELVIFDPANGQSCSSYLMEYIIQAGGRLLNPEAVQQCQFCPVSRTDAVLATLGIRYDERWRNFGITLVFSVVNVLGALLLYWSFRVPKGARSRHP